MLMCVKEGRRTRPIPTPSPPPQFLHSSPPNPPEGGKGGGVVYILSSYMQLIQLHMLRAPPFLEFGVRAGDTKKNTHCSEQKNDTQFRKDRPIFLAEYKRLINKI